MIDCPEAALDGNLVREGRRVRVRNTGGDLRRDCGILCQQTRAGRIRVYSTRGGVHDQIVVLQQPGYAIQDVGDIVVARQDVSGRWRIVVAADGRRLCPGQQRNDGKGENCKAGQQVAASRAGKHLGDSLDIARA